MKHLIFTALLTMLLCSCGSSDGSAPTADSLKTDSLAPVQHELVFSPEESTNFGSSLGLLMGIDKATEIDAFRRANPYIVFDTDAYLRGVGSAVNSDPVNLSYYHGLETGLAIVSRIAQAQADGKLVDREMLMQALEYYLYNSDASPADTIALASGLDSMMIAKVIVSPL